MVKTVVIRIDSDTDQWFRIEGNVNISFRDGVLRILVKGERCEEMVGDCDYVNTIPEK